MPMNRTLAICSGVVVGIAGLVMLTGISNPKQVIPTTNRPSGSEFFTSRASGVKIFTRKWIVSEAKGVALIVHGFGEHCGRYDYVARKLNAAGISVYSLDHQGHGRSEGLSGYVERFSHYADDVLQYVEIIRPQLNGLPFFLIGHSMGGAVSSLVALREPHHFTGLVLSAAAVIPLPEVAKPHLVFLANLLSDWIPRLPVEKLNPSFVSRDPVVVEDYTVDPYNYHGGMRVRWGAEILHTMDHIQKSVANIRLPILIMSGTSDKLVNPEGSRFVYENAQSSDKTIKLYDGLYHEIFNEPEKDTVIADLLSWLNAHIAVAE